MKWFWFTSRFSIPHLRWTCFRNLRQQLDIWKYHWIRYDMIRFLSHEVIECFRRHWMLQDKISISIHKRMIQCLRTPLNLLKYNSPESATTRYHTFFRSQSVIPYLTITLNLLGYNRISFWLIKKSSILTILQNLLRCDTIQFWFIKQQLNIYSYRWKRYYPVSFKFIRRNLLKLLQ